VRLAIFALTKRGSELGRRLSRLLPQSRLFLPEKLSREGESSFQNLRQALAEAFGEYETLVLIMATGIAVRLLAPLLRGKREDPGVVVMDERGRFAISLLGGHSRGANELARKLAFLSGGESVITTASDVNEIPPIDLLGKEFGWEVENPENLAFVAAALVDGEEVGVLQEVGEGNWGREKLPPNAHFFSDLVSLERANPKAALIITDRTLSPEFQGLLRKSVIYRPKTLVVGLGFHRNISCEEIEKAVFEVLRRYGLSSKSIRKLATSELKKDERGLLEFSQKFDLPFEFFSAEELKGVEAPSHSRAREVLGVPGVAEPSALLGSGGGELLVPKVKFEDVTVAVARVRFDERGKLFIVGTGPGDPKYLTIRAREVLRESEVVIGYRTYLKQIAELISNKEVISSGMGEEIERARQAISFASSGKKVALVSGGDPGIYGMSAAVFEVLSEEEDLDFELEIVPGVPALCAASALLGSPLYDFACISLSDLLIPWEVISRRLEEAAAGDFVIVLYNPKSRGRKEGLERAQRIILRHRPPSTPVGIVRNALRKGQKVELTELGRLSELEADMSTIVIVGSSSTFNLRGRMVTPRGYMDGSRSPEARPGRCGERGRQDHLRRRARSRFEEEGN